MQQIKIFKGVENDIAALESEVNVWIRKQQVRVIQILGNIAPQSGSVSPSSGLTQSAFAPSDLLLVVLYETAN